MTKFTNDQIVIVKKALDNLVECKGILKDTVPVLVKLLDASNQLIDELKEKLSDKVGGLKLGDKGVEDIGATINRLDVIIANMDNIKDEIEKFSLDDLMRELRKIIK